MPPPEITWKLEGNRLQPYPKFGPNTGREERKRREHEAWRRRRAEEKARAELVFRALCSAGDRCAKAVEKMMTR